MFKLAFQFFILMWVCCSCSTSNLLKNKYWRYYSETNTFSNESPIKLRQSICYNQPGVIDEEHCFIISFVFKDTVFETKVLNLETDTSKVSCKYDFSSVWNWEDEKYRITGVIEILDWKKDEVKLREDFVVQDFRRKEEGELKFKGVRKFKREENQ